MSFIQVIVENQVTLTGWQTGEAVSEAVVLSGRARVRFDSPVDEAFSNFLASTAFTNDVPGNPVKVARRLSAIVRLDIGQTHHDAVDRFVGKIFSIAEALRYEYPHQTRADRLVLPARHVTIVAEPGE